MKKHECEMIKELLKNKANYSLIKSEEKYNRKLEKRKEKDERIKMIISKIFENPSINKLIEVYANKIETQVKK